jgi:phage tail sheath gpL-like
MSIAPNSLAAGVSTRMQQATFSPRPTRLTRKPLIIGSYDQSKTGITANTVYTVNSGDHAGSLFGFGFEITRMVRAAYNAGWVGTIDVIPVAETGDNATITVSATGTITKSGTLYCYIGGDLVRVSLSKDNTATNVIAAINTAIGNDKYLPVTSVVNATPTQLDVTVKSDGVFGNGVVFALNLGPGEETPEGLTLTITHNDDGTGLPDITNALNALGTGTNRNENHYTCISHACGIDTTSLGLLSSYNGSSSDKTGCHDGEIGRFFQAVTGSVLAGSAGLTTIRVVTDALTEDMTNAVVWRPGSQSHYAELATVAMIKRELKAIATPEQNYVNDILIGIWPGDDTDDYNGNANLDIAVKAGVSTTSKDGIYSRMQDFVTMYRPDSVPVESNIWRSMRHQAVSQNIAWGNMTRFKLDKWLNITIVLDVTEVRDNIARLKARDKKAVAGELVSLAKSYGEFGFLYSSRFTIDTILNDIDSYISVRPGGKGFDYIFPVVYSGESGIISGVIMADANTAAAE